MNKNKYLYNLGNFLIVLSLSGLIYIFYPIINIYMFPPTIQETLPKKGIFITIPKIKAQAPVAENVDPNNSTEYNQILKKSVAHAKGTSRPGDAGTSFIFAHSSGPPWEQTRYNTIFLRLNELNTGDRIEIQKEGKIFKYIVSGKKEVLPTEVNFLEKNTKNQLILQTCTPIGTDLKRLLIFADPA